mmetsp:Transcript_20136/g.46924  ORF Transcript_20136/g.46924 Transcript_20136/m.46924 type:complete len:578 (-) Transcript_20136:151-1884(-)
MLPKAENPSHGSSSEPQVEGSATAAARSDLDRARTVGSVASGLHTSSVLVSLLAPPQSNTDASIRISLAEAHLRRGSWPQASLNILFSMFAASQIPFAIAQMGWTGGIVLFWVLTLCSWWSGHVLTDCCIHSDAYTWHDLGHAAFGRGGALLVEVLQTVGIVLTGMVQTQGAASVWQQAFPHVKLCASEWILVNVAPYLLFLQIPSFGDSGLLGIASVLTVGLTLWRVTMFLWLLGEWGSYEHVCYGGQTFSTLLSGVANMMFTFGVKNVLPEMTREMSEPRDMHKSWAVANGIVVPLYALFGFWGMYAFGIFNQGAGFVLQFKDDPMVRAYNIASAVVGYLPLVYGQICVFLKVELKLGVLPTDWCRSTRPDLNRCRWIPPLVFRLIFRLSVVAVYVFVAEALLGVGLGSFASLVGALSVSAFSFYLPWVLYLKLLWNSMSCWKKVIYFLWVIFGVAMAVLGTYSSIKEMQNMAVHGFFDAPCRQNAFYMGKFNTADIHGDGGYSRATGPGSFYATFYQAACVGLDGKPANINCAQYGACCQYDDTVDHVVCDNAAQGSHGNSSGSVFTWVDAEIV